MTPWPDLDQPHFPATMETLHLWAQIVGKVKLAALPWLNESWHVPLYVSGSGWSTGLMTYADVGFELMFDFLSGNLRLVTSGGRHGTVPLTSQSVADFHRGVLELLNLGGIDLAVTTRPSEIAGAQPFAKDVAPRMFNLDAAREWWRATIQAQRLFHRFRSRFTGKSSPIHLFWGSFDLSVSRFSGRPAPSVDKGGPNFSVAVARDAYADEQSACGFWPGGNGIGPGFYLEAWPEPEGLEAAAIGPAGARFDKTIGKWLLSYSVVRDSADPDTTLLEFLQSGYNVIADLGAWPRDRLERDEGPIGRPPSPRD